MSAVKFLESPVGRGILQLPEAVTSPLFAGPLLLALVAAPESTKQAALERLSVPASFDLGIAKIVVLVLLGIGVARYINLALNSIGANAWRVSAAEGWEWPKEIAVVTGGCSGIGFSIVQRLVWRNVRVAIIDVQPLPKIFEGNPLISYYKCDLTSAEDVAEAATAIRKELGHPSILINNAGITKPLSILEMDQKFLHKIFDVNCLCHWTTVQQFLPQMIKENKGHVVTVASMASFLALAKGADYSATKAAALSFHESLRSELKHLYKADGVLTTSVHPNFVQTPLVKDFASKLSEGGISFLTADTVADSIVKQVVSRRGGQIILPKTMTRVTGIRGWPTWLQEGLRDLVNRNAANM